MKKACSGKYPSLLLFCGAIAAWLLSLCCLSGKDWLPIPGKDLLPRKDAQSYFDSGVRDFQSGAHQAAIDEFTKAIVGDDNSDNYMMTRAMLGFGMPSDVNGSSSQIGSEVGK